MVEACFELQQLLMKSYPESENFVFLHPLNRPFLTYSAFIYQLFLRFCKADLRMVRKAIEYQSSRGEIEFAQYLCLGQDSRNFIHAWSPYGQYKEFLPICIPDIFDLVSKTAYFYNGCVIHNHEKDKCHFKRKSTFQQESQFNTKVTKLALSSKVKNIHVLWQCQWQNQKKTNQDVKDFMRNIYTNPPSFRLDARCAGMIRENKSQSHKNLDNYINSFSFLVRGGINECYNAYFSTKVHKGSLYVYDKDGQYGYIAMISAFPTGPYKVCKIYKRFSVIFNYI